MSVMNTYVRNLIFLLAIFPLIVGATSSVARQNTSGSGSGGTAEWTDGGTFLYPADNSGAEDVVIGGTTELGADHVISADGAVVFNQQQAGEAFEIRSPNRVSAMRVKADDSINLNATTWISDDASGPVLLVRNTRDNASNTAISVHSGAIGGASAGDDVTTRYYVMNDLDQLVESYRETVELVDETDGTEDSKISLGVNNGGTVIPDLFEISSSSSGALVVKVNEGSDNVDFIVESDNDTNIFKCDGGNDACGVGNLGTASLFQVAGRADQVQLLIEGFSTQTKNLIETEGSGGDDVFEVDNTGKTTIGDGDVVISADGNAVFNEEGRPDGDFRIETDNRVSAVFVDAGADSINLNAQTVVSDDTGSADPTFTIRNTRDNTSNTALSIYGNERLGTANVADDFMMKYYLMNDEDEYVEVVRETIEWNDETATTEDGEWRIGVASRGGMSADLLNVGVASGGAGTVTVNNALTDTDFMVKTANDGDFVNTDAANDEFHVGSNNGNAMVNFDGRADEIQIWVDANSTQTNLLADIENFDIDENGSIVTTASQDVIASTGTPAQGTLTLIPKSSLSKIDCQDPDGCIVSLSDTGSRDGQWTTIQNAGSEGPIHIEHSPATINLIGGNDVSLDVGAGASSGESIQIFYESGEWYELTRGRRSNPKCYFFDASALRVSSTNIAPLDVEYTSKDNVAYRAFGPNVVSKAYAVIDGLNDLDLNGSVRFEVKGKPRTVTANEEDVIMRVNYKVLASGDNTASGAYTSSDAQAVGANIQANSMQVVSWENTVSALGLGRADSMRLQLSRGIELAGDTFDSVGENSDDFLVESFNVCVDQNVY